MSSEEPGATERLREFQDQTRQLLRAQQEAYVAAIKAWRMGPSSGTPPPEWPAMSFETLPQPTEMAEATYAFAAKLLADQSRFMDELSRAIAGPDTKQR